jgi:predicted aspartyl protease
MVAHGSYDFLLDSGAAGIVVDPTVVEQQNLERFGRRIGATLGSFPEATTVVPQLGIGSLRMRNVVARVVGVPFHIDERTRLAGLLGFDFFADAVVHIDLAHGIAEAYPPDRFRAPLDAVAVPLGLDDKTPAVHLRAGTASARVVLDTGANRSIFETSYADRADFGGERPATATRVRGVGGYASVETARIPIVALAGIDMRNAAIDVTSADLGSDDLDGVVGTDLLRTYDLWFDYKTNAVYVRRTPAATPPPATAQRPHKR